MTVCPRVLTLSRRFITMAAILGVFLISPVTQAASTLLSEQQRDFLAAEKAFKKGDMATYRSLKSGLQDYVLYPYLAFAEARAGVANKATVNRFREQFSETPMSARLLTSRLNYLGKKGQWREYLEIYQGSSSAKYQCYALRAQGAIKGRDEDWFYAVKDIWLTGKSLPPVCNPLFNNFYASDKITSSLILKRVQLAIEKKNLSLAKFLSKKLNEGDARWYRLWLAMHNQPLETLESVLSAKESAPLGDAIVHGVLRYARKDTVAAWDFWRDELRQRFDFSQKHIDEVEGKLLLRAAWRHLPEAHGWFSLVSDSSLNDEARQWKVRTAIRQGDWTMALEGIDNLPAGESDERQWQYWRARALEQTGANKAANKIFQSLAKTTSYYGFLSAERLELPHQFTSIPAVSKDNAGAVDGLLERAGILRAKELLALDRKVDAMREWRHQTSQMSKAEKKLAATLAQRWGWHFAAILTVAKAGHLQDLELRFPLAYREEVERAAKKHGIDPSWVYGVMRRESAFRETAVSPAGALGLMQLMPATAKEVVRKLGLPKHSKKDLKTAAKNINLGAFYLKEVKDTYGGHEILATASYNAGPHRVKTWLPDEGVLEADVWVDSITFDETRAYVKAVFFYTAIFERKLYGSSGKLSERMPLVRTLEDIRSMKQGY